MGSGGWDENIKSTVGIQVKGFITLILLMKKHGKNFVFMKFDLKSDVGERTELACSLGRVAFLYSKAKIHE